MKNILRTSIAARSTAVILAIVSVVGLSILALGIQLTERQEGVRQQARLNELLDTVQRTVSIACFLSDKQLAGEVAGGLLRNSTVSLVSISSMTGRLAHRRRGADPGAVENAASLLPPGTLVRKVMSPFNPAESVGEIALVPDAAEIRRNVARASWLTALLLAGQILLIGIGVVVVVIRLVTRPIAGISARLHELRAEAGQQLNVPRGHEVDEIGRLVRDVNALADFLVKILTLERRLRVEREIGERKFRSIFDNTDTGIFQIDGTGLMTSWNAACVRFFSMQALATPDEARPMLMDVIGERREEARALISRAISEHKAASQDIEIVAKSGMPIRWVNLVLTPVEERCLQGVANDITERKHAEEAAQELAATDHLTGLGNRLAFDRKFERMIDECNRDPGRSFAMLLLDLDWFKQVNDTYGHAAGDEVLIRVARTLEEMVRKTDFVARIGGDEFVVLLSSVARRELIENLLRKIIDGINLPIPVGGGNSAKIGISIGAAVFVGPSVTKDELFRRADDAMYRAKEAGRNTYRFFENT
ncbi:MAG: sensor domain-containing diguanylate cyclase [Ideonella sp.]